VGAKSDRFILPITVLLQVAGGTDINPVPTYGPYMSWPIIQGYYKVDHSVIKPFGSNGMASINPSTGLVTVMSPTSGLYALAVEVSEYRNNVLISKVRRDIQIIVLVCPPNALPKHIGGTSFTVDAGNTLNFNITYTDNDSMFLSRSGLIFESSSGHIQPPYPTLPEVQGISSITTQFNWNTTCHHGKDNPYFFTVHVQDNGCPYKTTVTNFQVRVKPFDGPEKIIGPIQVCEYDTNLTYQVIGLSSNCSTTFAGGEVSSYKIKGCLSPG